jgi:heme oxygenase
MHSQSISVVADNAVINIMALLKDNTATAHKQLEKSFCFKRLFANDYTMNEYAQLLSYFYRYYAATESLLFADLPSEYQSYLQHRRKTHLLSHDLNCLNVNPDSLPECKTLPRLTTFAKKMGALYVLEGSLLGGRVIGRHLQAHFGENTVLPLNFYSCYGADLIVQWQGFSLFMGECFNHQNDELINDVIDSANMTFSSLQQWVDSGLIQHLPLN